MMVCQVLVVIVQLSFIDRAGKKVYDSQRRVCLAARLRPGHPGFSAEMDFNLVVELLL